MPESGWKLDKTINVSTLGMLAGAVLAVSMWVSSVNQKLDDVAQLIVDQRANAQRLESMDRRLGTIEANSTRNRQILEGRGE